MEGKRKKIVVMGGGLTGLAAGCSLSKAGFSVDLFERDSEVGGLSRTVVRDGFRFDLGGHRFFTKDREIERFVQELMDGELVSVDRTSTIYMKERYFDYPLKPLNAMFGLGLPTTFRILSDYVMGSVRGAMKRRKPVSLEDWVVTEFGRTMFDIYFKEYSEKVWGIECNRISAEWVSQRIKGLSLGKALKNAFFKFTGKDIPTLADRFIYPRLGIGRISDRLREEIERRNSVVTSTPVSRIRRSGKRILSAEVEDESGTRIVDGDHFVSSIPLPRLVTMLDPAPPAAVMEAATKLGFRDLVVVAVMLDKKQVTDQTWIYLPEKRIPFGRIHEPTNWSADMAPQGKTILVMEYFCFRGDDIWNQGDEAIADLTIRNLEDLDYIQRKEVVDCCVVRAPQAYPLFEVGYGERCEVILDYLAGFRNLHVSGRVGMFRYYNMDHAIRSGLEAAEKIISEEVTDKGARPGGYAGNAGMIRLREELSEC